ncbi:MAG: hypothetical protein KAJ03_01585 [Gammaproteobacteria bacterium]|nr:hypothetical protein [Gammaproteobacteria bacterium]
MDKIGEMELRRLDDIEQLRELEVNAGTTLANAIADVESTYEKTKSVDLSNATKRRARVDVYLSHDKDYTEILLSIARRKRTIAITDIEVGVEKRAFVMQHGRI